MRLTMGGEPTFVSVDDMEAREWNTDADGPQKKERAVQLIKRLKDALAPKGFIHKGQGKWYPGEPLPRWKYSAHWRNDGVSILGNDALIDLDDNRSSYTIEDAHRLSKELTQFLNIPREHIHPAMEDAFYFLWEENKVPVNIDPYKANLNDPLERQKLAELLVNGLGSPVGYVIPMEWNHLEQPVDLLPVALSPMITWSSFPVIRRSVCGCVEIIGLYERTEDPAQGRAKYIRAPSPLENFRAKVGLRYTQPVPEEELPREFYEDPIPKRRLKRKRKQRKGLFPL